MNADKCGLFSADVDVVFNPEAPGFGDPLLGVVDADARAFGDLARRYCFEVFDPDAIAQQIFAVERAVDTHRDAEFAWTTGEIVIRMRVATLAHDLDAVNRLECAHEDRMGNVRDVADDIELVIHPVTEVDVSHAAGTVHRLGSFRAAPTVSM